MIDSLDLVDQPLPHSLESEQTVLMALLVDKDAISYVVDVLIAEDFYSLSHQIIYQACLYLFRNGHIINHIAVAEILKLEGNYEKTGGFSYLNELMLSHISSISLPYHIDTVKQRSISRELIKICWEGIYLSFQMEGNDAMVETQKRMMAISIENKKEKTLNDILTESANSLEERAKGKAPGISTGFNSLDEILGGLRPSALLILAARPSMGKTALGLNIAANVAIHGKTPVLFFSLEMSAEEIGQRLLLREAGNTAILSRLRDKVNELKDIPLRIVDRAALGIPQLRAALMRYQVELGTLGLVVVDYLQLMKGTGENRVQEVSSLSRELKCLAKEFSVPVLCLSQLSRAVESRQDKRPMLSDLRESGAIEQDADVVMFIYREEYYNKEAPGGTANVIISKNRNGPTGEITLGFRPSTMQFFN